jgi:hypothetical protein
MKRILFLLSVLVIGLMSCKNDNTAGTPTQQYRGSAAPPVVPDKSKFPREITALTSNFGPGKDYWMFEFYLISPVDSAKSYGNMGRWFQFYDNGTYINGRWQEDIGNGSWFLREGPYGPFLLLDNVIDSEDMEWELQGLSATMEEWSWVGTKKYGANNNFVKAIRLYSKPTKEQFNFTRD